MTAEHLHEARMAIELMSVDLTIRKRDEASINRLRAFIEPGKSKTRDEKLDQLRSFHALLGELSGNPVFKLVIAVLTLVAQDFIDAQRGGIPDEEIEESLRKQRGLVEAICESDFAIARVRVRDYLEWVVRYVIPRG